MAGTRSSSPFKPAEGNRGLLQFMTKKDFGPFFEANYWGTGMPKE